MQEVCSIKKGSDPNPPVFCFVVPCFNESECLLHTMSELTQTLEEFVCQKIIAPDSFAIYVDDGSKDETWNLIDSRSNHDDRCRGLKLQCNAGHQQALFAGLMEARRLRVGAAVSIDADLQDDLAAIPKMLEHYHAGCDVVYGVKLSRSGDGVVKKITAKIFYSMMNYCGVRIVAQHADCRLLSAKALDVLSYYKETSLFLRALIPSFRLREARVEYHIRARQYGCSKYSARKMLMLAADGVTSFSAAPLRLSGVLAVVVLAIALMGGGYAIWAHMVAETLPGWTSLMVAVFFLGAVQLFCLAIMGEYIAKIFEQVKGRPRYVVEDKCGLK